jgi:integrase
VWAKLLWAGLNLTDSDLPATHWYSLPLIRALALTWLFAGLRSDELVRLRVGCIRWQDGPETTEPRTCLLDVPIHKTGTSYTKPVDPVVGHAIAAWEALRPPQPALLDPKTGERVAFLFCIRSRPVPAR